MTQKPSKDLQDLQDFNVAPWQTGITVCDPNSTKTTLVEELGYVYIVLKELASMLWNRLVM